MIGIEPKVVMAPPTAPRTRLVTTGISALTFPPARCITHWALRISYTPKFSPL